MTRDIRLPFPTCTHGLDSKTFTPPPMLSHMSLPQVFDWHLSNSPQHPFYIFDKGTVNDNSYTIITWEQAVKATYRVANMVSSLPRLQRNTTSRPMIGLYSSLESLSYMLTIMGVICAGLPVFLISDKASPATLEHLIVNSGVTHILTNNDDQFLSTQLADVQEKLENEITVSMIPSWSEISSEGEVEIRQFVEPGLDDVYLMVHSSGSTALPELNPWTRRMIFNLMWSPWFGEKDMCGEIISMCATPMGGLSGPMQVLLASSCGVITSGFPPLSLKPTPTLENVWSSLITTKSTIGYLPNPFLAVWSEDDNKIAKLAELRAVMFAGAPLAKDIGDKLAAKGVNLISFYGSSEAGLLRRAFPRKHAGMNWEWFTFHPLIHPAICNKSGDGIGELVLKTGPTHKATRTNCIYDGVPAYATGDLVEPHPTVPSLWRYVSRVSDQETIGVGGPKINVVALARMLMRDPLVSGAVLFSHSVGDSSVFGAIIEPSSNDLNDEDAIDGFKSSIWTTIEKYNTIVHTPARLYRSNIIVASPHKPFIYGDKGMPRRKDVINAYRDEIEAFISM